MTAAQLRAAMYDPPHLASDSRVCDSCRDRYEDAIWFPVLNSRTGRYHAETTMGHTACGTDASAGHWIWPIW